MFGWIPQAHTHLNIGTAHLPFAMAGDYGHRKGTFLGASECDAFDVRAGDFDWLSRLLSIRSAGRSIVEQREEVRSIGHINASDGETAFPRCACAWYFAEESRFVEAVKRRRDLKFVSMEIEAKIVMNLNVEIPDMLAPALKASSPW